MVEVDNIFMQILILVEKNIRGVDAETALFLLKKLKTHIDQLEIDKNFYEKMSKE